MIVEAHCGAHEIHPREINGIPIFKLVSSWLEVGFWIPTFHRQLD
jgi:hypothetical protein